MSFKKLDIFYGVFYTALKKNRQNNHQENRVFVIQLFTSIEIIQELFAKIILENHLIGL